MHSGPRAQSSLCEYTTQRRQLSYTLRPCTIITEDKWAFPNSVSECVMGWLMSWTSEAVTAWESLMCCLPWPKPQLMDRALVSEHHSAPLTRHTPTRSTGQSTVPQGRIQAPWPCASLSFVLLPIFHPLFHSCIMGRTSPLNCMPLVLLPLHEGAFL